MATASGRRTNTDKNQRCESLVTNTIIPGPSTYYPGMLYGWANIEQYGKEGAAKVN